MELEIDCGTVQFPKLWWFLLLHLSGCEWRRTRRRQQLWEPPYIINDIISTTLLTKQMHKSLRLQSIDTETFNHVLNNDYCSHNAIIIFSCWFGLMCCQSVIRVRGGVRSAAAIREAERWLTATEGKKQSGRRRRLYVEWQVKSGCQKMQWIFAVLFISWLQLNKSGGTCIACPSAFSSAP